MGDEFLRVQERIEAVLTFLKCTDDLGVRKLYLTKFKELLDEADKFLVPADTARQNPNSPWPHNTNSYRRAISMSGI